LISEIEEESIQKWQKEWNGRTKAKIMKHFFPNVQERLKININVTPKFVTMVTGHGNTRACFHCFRVMD
jgi:hypothetical protein